MTRRANLDKGDFEMQASTSMIYAVCGLLRHHLNTLMDLVASMLAFGMSDVYDPCTPVLMTSLKVAYQSQTTVLASDASISKFCSLRDVCSPTFLVIVSISPLPSRTMLEV